ncbi:MAG TPA: hypothetical protein VIH24_04795 [Candidatus Limnocylindria bacterium]
MRRRAAVAALTLAVLTACNVAPVDTPDPAAVPSGPLEAHGAGATGPIVEVGSGTNLGVGWRYAIYPSEDAWCTQLETVGVATAGCGDILPQGERAFGSVAREGPHAGGVTSVDGVTVSETATVWLITESGQRSPATLMPLEEAGLDGQAFIGFVPPDITITHVMSIALNGEILETYELP